MPPLQQFSSDNGLGTVGNLEMELGRAIPDLIVEHLGHCLLPAIEHPKQTNGLFVDYIALALYAHLVHSYSSARASQTVVRGGLAPWQYRRITELMAANLDGDVSLTQLAAASRLSASYFTRAFRRSTGVPSHHWLMQRRIDKAKDLLRNSGQSLNEIALACGFADQSHFTTVFTRMVGASPGAWRRARQN